MDLCSDKRRTLLVGGLLSAGTFALFWPVRHHDFIVYDDQAYIVGNAMVQRGLTWAGTAWAFTTFHAGPWLPLTWLSHMLDCQLYGLNPGGHHFTSLLLHSANAGLLCLALKRLTGALWRSALVAALFALHPMHVESFAWAAERKDVLSAFFFMLTLWAYGCYAGKAMVRNQSTVISNQSSEVFAKGKRSPTKDHRSLITDHRSLCYLLSLFFFAFGLMCKPMLVTVPFVLLLLDYWPLKRMQNEECRMQNAEPSGTLHAPRSTLHASRSTAQSQIANRKSQILALLLAEKLPFFALSALSCVLTSKALAHEGALPSLAGLPSAARLSNALVAYLGYLEKTVWPNGLSLLYLPPAHWPAGRIGLAILVLGGVSVLVLWLAGLHGLAAVQRDEAHRLSDGPLTPALSPSEGEREGRRPHLGARARRTSPTDGLRGSLAPAEGERAGVRGLSGEGRSMERGRGWLIVGWLWFLGMLVPVIGLMQVGDQYMADRYTYLPSIGLFVMMVWGAWAVVAADGSRRKSSQSADHGLHGLHGFSASGASVQSVVNSAFGCGSPARYPSQVRGLLGAAALVGLIALGALSVRQLGFWQNSETILSRCLAITPDNYLAYNNLGVALAQQGRSQEARANFEIACRLQPRYGDARRNLGVLLTDQGRFDEAAPYLAEAARLKPEVGSIYGKLGLVLEARGLPAQAVACYREGLRILPGQIELANNLAWILATTPDGRLRDGNEAVRLAQQACEASGYKYAQVVGTLAAAYAEAGRFQEAVTTAQRAIALSTAAGQPQLAERNRQLLELYRAGKPVREK